MVELERHQYDVVVIGAGGAGLRAVIEAAGSDRVALVTDATAAAGLGDGEFRLGAVQIDVVERVARVRGTSTIAGSTATMDQLFRAAASLGSGRDAALDDPGPGAGPGQRGQLVRRRRRQSCCAGSGPTGRRHHGRRRMASGALAAIRRAHRHADV